MQVTVCLEPADSIAHIVDMVGPFRAPTPGWVWPARMGGVVGMRRKAVVQAGDGCDVMGWFEEGGERGEEGGRSDERVAGGDVEVSTASSRPSLYSRFGGVWDERAVTGKRHRGYR